MMKIYVASSWRNEFYAGVVERLRDEGFKWSSVDADYMQWTPEEYRNQLMNEKAVRQFGNKKLA